LELELMAWLIAKERYALEQGDEAHAVVCREAQVRFVREHLAWWLPAFAHALRRRADGVTNADELTAAPSTFYGAVASALAAMVAAERAVLGIAPCDEPAHVNPPHPADPAACGDGGDEDVGVERHQ
jgi:TorA maturation chaperone TorD